MIAVDVERERISLGIKQLDTDAFSTFITMNDKGQIVSGKVKSVDTKGAEIDLGQDVVGYLRASEISRDRVEDARSDAQKKATKSAPSLSISTANRARSVVH